MKLKDILVEALPKGLVLDLFDEISAQARSAHVLVNKHFKLDPKRSKELEGQARFRLLEKSFEEICDRYGGVALENDVIPGTAFRVYQPYRRFQGATCGVILALAMMPEAGELPAKNCSRKAGVHLNFNITPRLDFDDKGSKPGDVFVVFLAARDREKAGHIAEVAIGMIDSEYESYPFYESIGNFLAGYSSESSADFTESRSKLVTLKKGVKKYQPPEMKPDSEDKGDKNNDSA